jgi:hypothetical protein
MMDFEMNGAKAPAQSLPFVEKYRPNDLTEIISHTDIVQTSK